MLGDGIVSFGVCPSATQDCRNSKASPKIVFDSADAAVDVQRRRARTRSSPCCVAELHVQRLVGRLGDAVERVDEVHVPRRAAELAVGRRAQADVALQRTTSRIASSSMPRSSSASIGRRRGRSRARSSSGGRSRLPTWSARNGGVSRSAIRSGSGASVCWTVIQRSSVNSSSAARAAEAAPARAPSRRRTASAARRARSRS